MKSDIHVMPEDEPHECNRQCPCNPVLEDENGKPQLIGDRVPVIVIHNAWRE